MKQGLVLDKVVLLGRTLDEYARYFALDPAVLQGRAILDVASGVSSFSAEGRESGLDITAVDLIYDWAPEAILKHCEPDLDRVIRDIDGLKTYKWDFYKNVEHLRGLRQKAYKTFLADYARNRDRYVAGRLPTLPFADGRFDLTLVSYLLFAYEDQLDYEFHRRSILDLMRVTRGEARIYPIVNFEAKRCSYIDRLKTDAALGHLRFEEVRTGFEFLLGSNWFLRIRHGAV